MRDRPDTLWDTRCPMPTASGLAIEMGWLGEGFAPDGIQDFDVAAWAAPALYR